MRTRILRTVALFLLIVPAVGAQDDGGRPEQVERVRLVPEPIAGALELSLESAVGLAIDQNPGLIVEKLRLEQTRELIGVAEGEYDMLFNVAGTASRQENIVASRFYPSGLYVDARQSPSVSLERRARTGAQMSVALEYARLVSTSNTQTLSPQYSANLNFAVSQPLLRDFGRDVGEAGIRVAETNAEIAEQNLFVALSELVQQVEERYWNLTFVRQDLEMKQRSLDIANQLLAQSQNLLAAGRVAPVSVLEARAFVADREEEVLTAEDQVAAIEDRLKSLLWLDLDATSLTPMAAPEPEPSVLDAAASLARAIDRRPELRALRRELEQRDVQLRFARNQLRPRLDLNASYTMSGLSGKPNPECIDPTAPTCIPVGINVGNSILADRTGARDAFTSILSTNPFDTWSVELRLQIPIGNRTAEARYSEATLREIETRTTLSTLEDQIQEEIRNAVREAETARERIEASRRTIEFVEGQLDGLRQQFDAGLASSYDVIRALDEFDRATTTEIQAIMDYNVALSRVRLAEGAILEHYNIGVENTPRYEFEALPQID